MTTHPTTTDRGTIVVHDSAALACPRCGTIDTPTLGPGAGSHWKSARCRHCNAWLSWVSRYTPVEREARRQAARAEAMARKPPTVPQLSYLTALGYTGPTPATMLAASHCIESLTRKVRP